MSVILGKNPWRTKIDLYNEKVTNYESQEENRVMRRGRLLETLIAYEYNQLTNIELTTSCQEYKTNTLLKHPNYPWLFGNIDRFVPTHKALAEIKTVSLNKYINIKNDGLPEHWIIQIQHYLNITGFEKAVLLIFCPDKWEFLDEHNNGVWIKQNKELIKLMTNEATNFWQNHILKKIPPKSNEYEASKIDSIKIESSKIKKISSKEWDQLSIEFKNAKESLDDAKKHYEKKETAIKNYLDKNNISIGSGGHIEKISFLPVSPRITWDTKAMYNELRTHNVKNIEERFKRIGKQHKRLHVKFK